MADSCLGDYYYKTALSEIYPPRGEGVGYSLTLAIMRPILRGVGYSLVWAIEV